MLEITYGHPVKSLDDPYFVLMDEATRGTSDGGAAAAIVDFFPFRAPSSYDTWKFTKINASGSSLYSDMDAGFRIQETRSEGAATHPRGVS